MGGCKGITDAGLAHLTGIRTLKMLRCTGVTGAGLRSLNGIRSLSMDECSPEAIAAARALGLPLCKGESADDAHARN
jgi:hypothetical protein